MSDLFDRGRRGGRRPARPSRGRRARPVFEDESDEEEVDADEFDDEVEVDEPPAPARRRRAAPRSRGAKRRPPQRQRKRSSWGLFGGGHPEARRRGGGRVDFGAIDEDEDEQAYGEEEGDWEDEPEEERPRRRRRPAARRPAGRQRLTLLELCTPVFGQAAILPRDAGGVHPGYEQFRQGLLGALQRIESEAPEHGIEKEDAAEARYALALFMDEQVGSSQWSGRAQWSSEPLSMVLLNDPQGGVNFFTHMESLGDRQKAVKRVYLLCLALGYRGRFIELDPTQQAAQIGEIRQKLLRSIQEPLSDRETLFPEAYQEAIPLEGQVPPPPRWWVFASVGATLVLILCWWVLSLWAGSRPNAAKDELDKVIASQQEAAEARAGSSVVGQGEASRP